MMSRFSSFVLALLLLVASGQVMAAGTCTTTVTGTWATAGTWADGTALVPSASCDNVAAIPANGDSAVIAHDVTVGAAATINAVTVNAGKTLTLSATLTATTATINGGITYTAGTFPAQITSIGELFTNSAATFTLPATVTSVGGVSTSGALTLAAANVVTGNVTITTGGSLAAASVLKLAPTGDHLITPLAAGTTISSLDLSGATAAKKITSATGPVTLTNGVTFPAPVVGATKIITFSAGSSAAISLIVPAATVATCAVAGTAVAVGAYTLAADSTLTCTVPAAVVNNVSAPIFSTKEKAAVFSQEVK